MPFPQRDIHIRSMPANSALELPGQPATASPEHAPVAARAKTE
jgi:small-conductance mechanosensitive channel